MNGLDSPEAHQFYNGFVNGRSSGTTLLLTLKRLSLAKILCFNFKHWIFFNERLSLVGENQVVMQGRESPQIKMADVRVVYLTLTTLTNCLVQIKEDRH